ncbi:MAG: tetratricopeptide repeat protein [Dysgonamonadaceae bacterium]|jgi:tetratricopeptide (TPR) repeat protein|nr:tetratricopeptide repeat protein [Dysgonamonadaceae bacterium]
MLKVRYIIAFFGFLALLVSCTSAKNTAGTRWYHSFNTRYNIYFNGETAYQAALKTQQESYEDNYSKMLPMFTVSALPKEKTETGGPFNKSIEKAVKAIKMHSIQTKPEKQTGKRNDPKYKEWMNRTEYNPFLHHAWMLMGQSQFQNGDFPEAASSFSYISRLYLTQPEIAVSAKTWQARCYVEMGWFYEAEDILSKIKKDGLPAKLQDWYDTVYADFLIQQKKYAEAVPYLQTAIRSEKNRGQKNRERYLLGQIYSTLGEKELAYNAFRQVSGAYPLEFAAKIRQTEVFAGNNPGRITGTLQKMAKSSKNKNYLDQVYYALGNVYLSAADTAKAIESYESGVEKSVRNGLDKALNQIRLGDIYFEKRKFIQAQPNYAEALPHLKKEDEAYPRVFKRSAVLDELAVYAEAVELQDSLLRLSRMTEEERLTVVQKIIDDLKKKEAEEQEKQAREDYLAQQEDFRAQVNANRPNTPRTPVAITPPGNENAFYFYSPQVVAVGKTAFQQKWGRRKLEDDWRRRNKINPMSDALVDTHADESENMENEDPDTGSEPAGDATKETPAELSSDPYDPQFYLQQIPVSEEDIAASNLIVADGLYNMALVYKDGLNDAALALETFDQLDFRFPGHENKLQAYYHTYLIYLKEGNTAMADMYKQKIRTIFPESEWAVAMADPNYEYNLRMMDALVDSLYQDTYQAYIAGEVNRVRINYARAEQAYGTSALMPKFMFLNALHYVQTNDAEQFKAQLKSLISKYPDADVSVLASEMMKGFQRGLLLSASGDNLLARGGLFTIRFGGSADDAAATDSISFSPETVAPHKLLIIYPQGSVDDNLLLYTVASFNFGNFIMTDFDLERTTMNNIRLLQIKGFENLQEVMQYVQMIYAQEGYAQGLERSVVIVPVSLENYDILMRGKTLESYMQFFEEHFGKLNPYLIERWKLAQQFEQLDIVEISIENSTAAALPDSSLTDSQNPINLKDNKTAEELKEQSDTLSVTSTVYDLERQRAEQKTGELIAQAEDLLNRGSQLADDVSNTLNEISADPIRGLQKLLSNLFGKKSSNAIDKYAKEQEKAEKERQKQWKREQGAADKALREEALQKEKERNALLKKQADEEKALLKAKKKQEAELAKKKKQEAKAKVDEKKRLQKEKEDARKRKTKERRETQKLKQQERQANIKARKAARKKR